jgi:hypothetical protein
MFLDLLPFMVFTNMFAIFYLETICMTKRTAQKQSDDKKMGFIINYLITGFFILLFLIPILLTLSDSKYTLGWTFKDG